MKNLTKFAFFAALCGVFAGCSGDGGSNSSGSELPESIKNFSDIADYDCNDARQCAKLYAEDVDDTLQCVSGEWGSFIASIKNACSEVSSSSSENENPSSSDNEYENSSSSKKLSSSSSDESGEVQESESSSSEKLSSSSGEVILSSSQNEQSSSSVDPEIPQGGVSSSSEESSSSSVESSSSGESSSSFTGIDPSTVIKGTMTDERDGKVYKTVTIGTQTWMAENLNYAYNVPTSYLDSSSFCFLNELEGCAKYGRLYLWSAAMDSASVFSNDGKDCGYYGYNHGYCAANGNVRGVCPEGWHLPSDDEWYTLFTTVGGSSSAGTMLKSTSDWYDGGNGDDSFGFSVLPAGYRCDDGLFDAEGYGAKFWSSTENDSFNAFDLEFSYRNADGDDNRMFKKYAFSVRCLKD